MGKPNGRAQFQQILSPLLFLYDQIKIQKPFLSKQIKKKEPITSLFQSEQTKKK